MSSHTEIPPPPRHSVSAASQQAYIEAGDLEGAEQVLRCSIARTTDNWVARLELSRVLFWQGRPAAAHALLEQLLAEREDPWCLSFLGQVRARLGDTHGARSVFARALRLDPDNHEALTFLYGDTLEQFRAARECVIMRQLSCAEALAVAELCAAIDFKTGQRFSPAAGPISQSSLDRANILFDLARVGRPVERCLSLHERFGEARRVVIYTSLALGDSVLGLAIVDTLERYFATFPERRVPVEIVSPYAYVFAGLEARYLGLELTSIERRTAQDHAERCRDDLRRRTEPVIAITNAGPPVHEYLASARDLPHVREVIDAHIDRFARGLATWRGLRTRREIGSYPARIARFMEMVLGHKLHEDPTLVRVELVRPPASRDGRYHCLIESASRRSKTFCPEILLELLSHMAEHCRGSSEDILFCSDPTTEESLAHHVRALPLAARRHIRIVSESLPDMVPLLAGATSVISTDTGLAHVTGAMGVPLLVLFTAASPVLWQAGGANVRVLATPSAWAAHASATPVNMPDWDAPSPLMAGELSGREIFATWRELIRALPSDHAAIRSQAS